MSFRLKVGIELGSFGESLVLNSQHLQILTRVFRSVLLARPNSSFLRNGIARDLVSCFMVSRS